MNYTEDFFNTQDIEFDFEVGDHIDNKFLHATIISANHRNRNGKIEKGYECKCDKCGYEFHRPYGHIISGIGCGACSGRTLVKGINDIPTTDPWMVKYFQGGAEEASNYTKGSGKKFYPICPFCGKISDRKFTPNKIRARHGFSCECKDGISMPNKIIRNIMDQALRQGMILSFEKEHLEYDRNGTMRKFDMLFTSLNNEKYFVEMDGGYHGEIIKRHRKSKFVALPASKFLPDILKDEIAETLGISMIRIDCYKSEVDYIKKNLIESDLSQIIDLDKIDWHEVEDFCFNNLMRDICDYKNEHPELFASEIGEIFHISTQVIRKYLKRGAKLGLCEYIPKEEAKRANAFRKFRSIRVHVENIDTKEQWEFNSIIDFCKKSKEIIDGKNISKSMFEKRFNKTKEDFIIIDTGKHKFLIRKIRRND